MTTEVSIAIYDLTHGLASQFSQSILGQHLSGIYHTGLRTHSLEFFYGGGIQRTIPGQTPFGTPTRTVNVGQTTKSLTELNSFLNDIREDFSMYNYDLLDHNCNHFTERCLNFLMPDDGGWKRDMAEVMSVSEIVKDSPLGGLVKGFMENVQTQAGFDIHTGGVTNMKNSTSSGTSSSSEMVEENGKRKEKGWYVKELSNEMIMLKNGDVNRIKQHLILKTKTKNELNTENVIEFAKSTNPDISFASLDLLRYNIINSNSCSTTISTTQISQFLNIHCKSEDERPLLMCLRLVVNALVINGKQIVQNENSLHTICDTLYSVITSKRDNWLSFKAAAFLIRNLSIVLSLNYDKIDKIEIITRLLYVVYEGLETIEKFKKDHDEIDIVVIALLQGLTVVVEYDTENSKDLLMAYGFNHWKYDVQGYQTVFVPLEEFLSS